jgi:hypothetical protein
LKGKGRGPYMVEKLIVIQSVKYAIAG